jgi:hypothetical protein
MRQAQDRERKLVRRNNKVGRFKRGREYQEARAKRREGRATTDGSHSHFTGTSRPQSAVLLYGRDPDPCLGFLCRLEVTSDDPKTTPGARPRAPPAS